MFAVVTSFLEVTTSPLPSGTLSRRIQRLADRVGFPFHRIFVLEGTIYSGDRETVGLAEIWCTGLLKIKCPTRQYAISLQPVVMERLSEFRFDFNSIRLIEIESISFEIIENFDYCAALDKAVKYLM